MHLETGKSKRNIQRTRHLNDSPAIQALHTLITDASIEI